MRRLAIIAFAAAAARGAGSATPPEAVGRLPAMGYNTWNDVRCEGVSGARIMELAHGLVDSGFAAKGYRFLNVDDCWQEPHLSAAGELIPSKSAFPDGLEPVIAAVHRLGLKFGLYADRGFRTCAFRAGSRGHEKTHAAQLRRWGVDYLKYDSCWSPNFRRKGALEDYARMADALAAEAPGVHFSLCGWSWWYAEAVSGLPGYHSWRVGADCDEWGNIYEVARTMEGLGRFAGPGKGYNDPDMLVGTSSGVVHLTPAQSRTQFDLWCVLAAPLLLGEPPQTMNAWDRETYGNAASIAVDQDPRGAQGFPVHSTCPAHVPKDNWWCSPWSMPRDVFEMWTAGLRSLGSLLLCAAIALGFSKRRRGGLALLVLAVVCFGYIDVLWQKRPRVDACVQVWAKPLAGGSVAAIFVNWGPNATRVACDVACLGRAGVGFPFTVTPLRGGETRIISGGELYHTLDGDGASLLVRLSPVMPA
mmetsp:Transcript_9266/g.27733  ORF Transcript_9266/g.27733 Transcript_9266/m.27733 type:complete len:474 (+) Transcript_9266:192-1613(+)